MTALRSGSDSGSVTSGNANLLTNDAISVFSKEKCNAWFRRGRNYSCDCGNCVAHSQSVNDYCYRRFTADPSVPSVVSRFALGAGGWIAAFPQIFPLSIQPQPSSSFGGGLSLNVSVGNGPPYETASATRQPATRVRGGTTLYASKWGADRLINCPPICPPRGVSSVLNLKFYTKIFTL